MKKVTNINFANLSKEQTNELTKTVLETVAMDYVTAKNFTIVDLWNIQRKSKTIGNSRKSALLY